MPETFSFHPKPRFSCHLRCSQCTYRKDNGERCRNRVCHGIPTCWIHAVKEYKVQRKDSPVHGKGLFAVEDIARDAWICPYGGEEISNACITQRYGQATAPYAVQATAATNLDGACVRGLGCIANGRFNQHGRSLPVGNHNAIISRRRGAGLWLKATRIIRAGREIFVHYGDTYILQDNHYTKRRRTPDTRPC